MFKNCVQSPLTDLPDLPTAAVACTTPSTSYTVTSDLPVLHNTVVDCTVLPSTSSAFISDLPVLHNTVVDTTVLPSTSSAFISDLPVLHNTVVDCTVLPRTSSAFISDQTKIVIAKVYHYFEQEYEELKKSFSGLEQTPLSKFRQRTALATGVSETAVEEILQEEARRQQQEEATRNESHARKRPRQTDRRKTWSELIGRPDLAKPDTKPKSHYVCWLHFDKSVIILKPQLQPDALPSKLLPSLPTTSSAITEPKSKEISTQTEYSNLGADTKSVSVQTSYNLTEQTQTSTALSSSTPRKRSVSQELKVSELKRIKLQNDLDKIKQEVQLKNKCKGNSSSEEDSDNYDDDDDPPSAHEDDMFVVKEEPIEEAFDSYIDEPEIYVEQPEVKIEPDASGANDALADPISIDFKTEPLDEEPTTSKETVVTKRVVMSIQGKNTKRSALAPASASAPRNAPPAPPRANAPPTQPRSNAPPAKPRANAPPATRPNAPSASRTPGGQPAPRSIDAPPPPSGQLLLLDDDIKMEQIDIEEGFS